MSKNQQNCNKNVDILVSAHDAFLDIMWTHSQEIGKPNKFKSGASKTKVLNRIDKLAYCYLIE
jgi:hypothetical protein